MSLHTLRLIIIVVTASLIALELMMMYIERFGAYMEQHPPKTPKGKKIYRVWFTEPSMMNVIQNIRELRGVFYIICGISAPLAIAFFCVLAVSAYRLAVRYKKVESLNK